MQNAVSLAAIYKGSDLPLFGLNSHPPHSYYPPNFLGNQQFEYNPFASYRNYWRPSNEYQMPSQCFSPGQNYWNQCFMNPQGLLRHQNFNDYKQNKVEASEVKMENSEEAQSASRVPKLRQPVRRPHLHKKHRKNNACYYWSSEQNRRYTDFLDANAPLFNMSLTEKKNVRINVLMSKKIKTRNPQQCHSHHQKMVKKYGSIESIVQQVRRKALESAQIKSTQGCLKMPVEDQVHTVQKEEMDL